MTTALVPGSIGAVAKREGVSLAESFASADVVVIVDCSGSMDANDATGGRSRYEVALSELAALQNAMPGKIAVLAFSNSTVFCPSGQPPKLFGSTDLAGALKFARVADTGDIRFVVISDGQPDDGEAALREARQYKGRIDVIYVGPELAPTGRDFLTRLAHVRGGVTVTADKAQQLAAQAQRLLLSA